MRVILKTVENRCQLGVGRGRRGPRLPVRRRPGRLVRCSRQPGAGLTRSHPPGADTPQTGGIDVAAAPSRLDAVINLAKRRGFVFPSGAIYGGARSAGDYGPLVVGVEEHV